MIANYHFRGINSQTFVKHAHGDSMKLRNKARPRTRAAHLRFSARGRLVPDASLCRTALLLYKHYRIK